VVEPELGVIQEVERGVGHPLVLRCASYSEVPRTHVQPWQGIAGVIVLRELQFVGSGQEVVSGIGGVFDDN
jgi:hypothetical protein